MTDGISFTNGDDWEAFCVSCLKVKHQHNNFKEVNASDGGDYGLDGFNAVGDAYQCFCPEKSYTDDELYGKLRDKVTEDIMKLDLYKVQIKELLNNTVIKVWNFTSPKILYIPKFINHCNKYENIIRGLNLDFIDPNFKIGLKDLNYFAPEMPLFLESTKKILDFKPQPPSADEVDEFRVEVNNNTLIGNAVYKTNLLYAQPDNYRDVINQRVNYTIEEYMVGEDVKRIWLKTGLNLQYEKFLRITLQLESQIKMMSTVPFTNRVEKMEEIRTLIKNKIDLEFSNFISETNRQELANSLLADFLMRCPLNFV